MDLYVPRCNFPSDFSQPLSLQSHESGWSNPSLQETVMSLCRTNNVPHGWDFVHAGIWIGTMDSGRFRSDTLHFGFIAAPTDPRLAWLSDTATHSLCSHCLVRRLSLWQRSLSELLVTQHLPSPHYPLPAGTRSSCQNSPEFSEQCQPSRR